MKRASALIVAAGRGRRFGAETPKQYVPIGGICALRRCLDTFLAQDPVAVVQVVIHPNDRAMYDAAVAGLNDPRLAPPVHGGETRVGSVLAGLTALKVHQPDSVLVHDGARPFVSPRIIRDVLAALDTAQAAFAALRVVDALWRVAEGAALEPVPREGLWRAQTPQGFRFDALFNAHMAHEGDAADDVEIARAMGIDVTVVRGAPENFKITSPEDLARAEQWLTAAKTDDSAA